MFNTFSTRSFTSIFKVVMFEDQRNTLKHTQTVIIACCLPLTATNHLLPVVFPFNPSFFQVLLACSYFSLSSFDIHNFPNTSKQSLPSLPQPSTLLPLRSTKSQLILAHHRPTLLILCSLQILRFISPPAVSSTITPPHLLPSYPYSSLQTPLQQLLCAPPTKSSRFHFQPRQK